MLLPSDVARLVLGYLQQEKLASTCRSFIVESPNLKEYAEHHTEDGAIPGCLLSLFGKSLTTILNEYITMKSKENRGGVPFMMSSLWKKLDLTLSQIRSMQESAAFINHQRVRTRKGIHDRLRTRLLTSPMAVSGSTTDPVIQQTSTPIMATQYILRPLHTPSALQPSSSFVGESDVQNSNSTSISIVDSVPSSSAACTPRKQPSAATASPMRRKQDTQRRRRAAQMSSATVASDADVGEDLNITDNDFPQMVIENAREKILSNKSLQEKLAENINKFLGSDSAGQSSKQADGTTAEQETSIDEILGLQGGEIHMSEEAIHDILTQTELDPDFQELYDLFACVTSKAPKTTSNDSSTTNTDPKSNVTEKGKKLKVVERLLDMDGGGSAECSKKTEVCSKEKESANLPDQQNEKSLVDQTSQLPSTSQQAHANEISVSENPNSSSDNQNATLIITQCVDSDILMDTCMGLPGAEVVVTSQESEIEMKNISPSKEGAAIGFHIAEDSLSPKKVAEDKSAVPGASRTARKELKNIPSIEVTINGTVSKETQQGTGYQVCLLPLDVKSTPKKKKDQVNKPSNAATNQPENTVETVTSTAKELIEQNSAASIDLTVSPEEMSGTAETATLCSAVPSTSKPVVHDSSIVTLNIIADDLTDAELNDAVKSIDGDNYATIILSPLVKSQDLKKATSTQEDAIIDLTDSPLVGEQTQLVTQSSEGAVSMNTLSGDCTIYSISGNSNSTGECSVVQLMPAPSSTFPPAANIFINSCMANGSPALQSNVLMLSNNSASNQKQPSLFQTPPRPGSVYTVGQTMSPKLSQGSTIILASPVQPVLQGVMGMFPLSLVGQSGSTFTAPSHQILHVPISKPIMPKLPLPPRSLKSAPPKSGVNTGKSLSNLAADSSSGSSSLAAPRLGNEDKKTESLHKPDDTTVSDSITVAAKAVETHRRVLCFDGTTSASAKIGSPSLTNSKSQKNDKKETVQNVGSNSGSVASSTSNVAKENKKTESVAPSIVKNVKAFITSTTTKNQAAEKRPGSPHVTLGNKENVLHVETENQETTQVDKRTNTQESEKNVNRPQDTSKKQNSLPNILRRTPQKVPPERVCPTSPLLKQASQLLQGMQFQSPTSKQSPREDLPLPPTTGSDDKSLDKHVEQTRTPTSKRQNEDGGTPKPMFPPATPDLPSCSPASEAGSENSVNMAAHTLMILSRATLAKSSGNTPLKDNAQQLKSSKSSKKRKLDETEESERQSNKKDHLSPSALLKKKTKKHRKKSMDSFPAGMDVDKFLMSLHYDE